MVKEMTGLEVVAHVREGSSDLEDMRIPMEELFDEA